MRPFALLEPTTLAAASQALQASQGRARLLAGGSDLLGELKEDIVAYEQLISLAGCTELRHIQESETGLQLGALVTLAELEYDPRLHGPWRILAEAARGVATPEIRAQGTLGGNLCQRPRCLYYRSALSPCLKKGGTECPAVDSPYQDYLSIMGGQGCFSVHASDLAPVLMALDAEVTLRSHHGSRTLPLAQFFLGPEHDVQRENSLAPDEVLTLVSLPPPPATWRGTSLKARERTAGDFPLVSVAVGYTLQAGVMRHVRLVLGGVAPVPWPSPTAMAQLEGQPPSVDLAASTAEAALAAARPLRHNAFKVDIARALITRAIMAVAALPR